MCVAVKNPATSKDPIPQSSVTGLHNITFNFTLLHCVGGGGGERDWKMWCPNVILFLSKPFYYSKLSPLRYSASHFMFRPERYPFWEASLTHLSWPEHTLLLFLHSLSFCCPTAFHCLEPLKMWAPFILYVPLTSLLPPSSELTIFLFDHHFSSL